MKERIKFLVSRGLPVWWDLGVHNWEMPHGGCSKGIAESRSQREDTYQVGKDR